MERTDHLASIVPLRREHLAEIVELFPGNKGPGLRRAVALVARSMSLDDVFRLGDDDET